MRGLSLSKWAAVCLTATCLWGGSAAPVSADLITIDFSNTPDGAFPSYTESGVTFRAVTGNLTSTMFGNTPNGTRGIIGATSPFQEILASIEGGATLVSIDLGDFGADADLLFLQAFDALGTLLGTVSELLPGGVEGMRTLTFSHPDIASVRFGARDPAINGSSVFADNFRFESTIPEPASAALLGMGALGLLAWKRHGRRARPRGA